MSHVTDATDDSLKQGNASSEYHIGPSDLPLSCPMPDMKLWDSHPRVYLPVEDSGRCKCPYCGAVYILDA